MRKNKAKNLSFFALGFLLVAALGVSGSLALFYHPQPPPPRTEIGEPAPEPPPVVDPSLHPLTGFATQESATTTRPFAVVIDNAPEARPAYGLSRADIVYTTLVEGGITRFVALFSSQQAEKIGPVRSARPYFIRQAQDWDAIFVHSGGSTASLKLLQQNPPRISDLNEFSNGPSFWRTRAPQPHNLFTTSELLLNAATKREYSLDLTALPTWSYSAERYPSAPSTTSIAIPYQLESMKVAYYYNASTHSYDRTLGASAHYDGLDGKRISPANVLLVFKNLTDIPDPQQWGLIDFADNGAGEITLLSKGQRIQGRWSRSGDGPTVYSTVTGRTLLLSPGQTFIEIIPSDYKDRIKFE